MPSSSSPPNPNLPLRQIPGGYGLPFFGAIKDRLDYYYTQGQDEFFRSRIKNYNSTVFRMNAPPGPFNAHNSKVVVLLDAISFPVLFDTSIVQKKNIFVGTYMPSTHFTGGYRICSYLDPSEPKHSLLKAFFLKLLRRIHKDIIPNFQAAVQRMFTDLETELSSDKGEAYFNPISDRMAFDFEFRLFTGKSSYDVAGDGNGNVDKWLFLQLAPLVTLGLKLLPNCLEDLLLHTFPLPFFPVKSGYNKFRDGFESAAGKLLDEAEKEGIDRDEALHNLLFLTGFNAYGGAKVGYPALLKYIGGAGQGLHRRLAEEIRSAIKEEGGKVSLGALNRMPLTKSVVWEALRIEPPVPFQYGVAKEDITVSSHDASFLIKKGETIFGYQPFATRDPKVFENPDEFVGDRFMGKGEELIKYIYWSNGRETEDPSVENKQCPAKDMVVLLSTMMVVEFFIRYDTFTVETGKLLLGSTVTFKSLTKAK